MDATDPETWRWIWMVAAVVFAAGEIAIAGTFFLAPFAVGAAVAAVLAFLDVGLGGQWLAFVVISGGSLAAMRPLSRRLDEEGPHLGIGSHRQLGQRARVIEQIDPDVDGGFVMLGAEQWRAETATGQPIPVGTIVSVTEVRGTRVVVTPVADPASPEPSSD